MILCELLDISNEIAMSASHALWQGIVRVGRILASLETGIVRFSARIKAAIGSATTRKCRCHDKHRYRRGSSVGSFAPPTASRLQRIIHQCHCSRSPWLNPSRRAGLPPPLMLDECIHHKSSRARNTPHFSAQHVGMTARFVPTADFLSSPKQGLIACFGGN